MHKTFTFPDYDVIVSLIDEDFSISVRTTCLTGEGIEISAVLLKVRERLTPQRFSEIADELFGGKELEDLTAAISVYRKNHTKKC